MAKRYSVQVENDEVVSVQVDERVYRSPDEVPDPQDRKKLRRMIARMTGGPGADVDMDLDVGPDEPARRSGDPTKIILGVFLGVAVLMFVIVGISGYFAARRMGRELEARGTVVSLAERQDSEGDVLFYPVVAYNLPGYGIMTVELSMGSRPAAYAVGEVVTVRYDSQDPTSARIASPLGWLSLWILPMITGVLGAAFLGAVLLVRWIGREPDEKDLAGVG